MLIGHIGWIHPFNPSHIELSNLIGKIKSSTTLVETINFGSYSGAVCINKKFPVTKKDYLFIDDENGILVLVDGFVYNQKELTLSSFTEDQLDLPLPEFLFILFLLKGPDFVKYLNGDFAICIYQRTANSVLFFRDHLGIRPLAVSQTESGAFFSTDPIGLSKALNHNEKADVKYIINLFLTEAYDYTLVPNKSVRIIPPAHYMQIANGQEILKQYWFPERIKKDRSLNSDQVFAEIRDLVANAVKIRSDQRFRASVHVSGGLDSGVVAGLVRKEYPNQNNFYGFSWSPPYTLLNETVDFDERCLVESICNMNNIIPIFVNFTAKDIISQMKNWQFPSEFSFENRVIKIAKSNDVNLLFSGWGGDEFISISNLGIDADLIKDFSWRSFLKKYPLRYLKKSAGSLIFNVLFPTLRRSYSKFKTYPAIYPYIKKSLGSNLIPKKQRFHYGSRRKAHLQLLQLGHLSDRTKDWHIYGYQNGIEYRYPLLDKRIIEFMLKVPSRCLVDGSNNRILLRSIGKDLLPELVLNNKSKDDPVKSHYYAEYSIEATKLLMNDLEDFRSNQELDFVDFNLLEKNIQLFLKTGDKKLEDSIWSVLYCLKRAHEFTKGYNDHS